MRDRFITYEQLENKIKEFLKEHKSASLASCLNNVPRSSPVQYFMGKGFNIYIPSTGGQKFNAIERNPTICLLVNTEYIDYRKIKGVQIFGNASTSLKDKKLIEEAKDYIFCNHLLEEGKLQIIKIVPEEIIYLDAINQDEDEKVKQVLNIQNKIVDLIEESMIVFL